MSLRKLKNTLKTLANPAKRDLHQRFFKTGPGQYGEGDQFLGITVPELRKLAKQHKTLPLSDLRTLLKSTLHEERMIALYILIIQYEKTDNKKLIFDFYIKHRKGINNWDLIDTSTPNIMGDYLLEKDKTLLYKWAKSGTLWERRMSIMATFTFIKNRKFEDALAIADILLNDSHDLIHKAVGWMLREIGNRDLPTEEKFLKPRYKSMPRTMLRYSIEKFPGPKRKAYLKGEI
jgi:3-methyladenine DNA glycosylase AlkD